MRQQILVTGATGALGPPLLIELLRGEYAQRIGVLIRPRGGQQPDPFVDLMRALAALGAPEVSSTGRLFPVAGNVDDPNLGLSVEDSRALARHTDLIIHAAADTRFRAPPFAQKLTNVQGTSHVLTWGRRCSRLRQVLLVSTTCVAGTRVGPIAETLSPEPVPAFVNYYEESKWNAEQIAAQADLPVRVVRLSTCVGSQATGMVHRLGGLHHAVQWLYRGLVPLVPGTRTTGVDLIPTELAAAFLARATATDAANLEVYHVAAGRKAAPLAELLEFLAELFHASHDGWRRGQIAKPLLVDEKSFARFRQTILKSRDAVFGLVLEALESFLPALLYPKTYETSRAEALSGGPLPWLDWRGLVARVVAFCLRTNWGRPT